MVQINNNSGICGTCIYRSDCLYLRKSLKEGKPVFHCEEFNDSSSKKEWETFFQTRPFLLPHALAYKSLIPGWRSS